MSYKKIKNKTSSSYKNLTVEELQETLEMYKKLEKESCEKQEYSNADIANKKINEMQKILDKKNIKETENRHIYEITDLEVKQKNEIEDFNKKKQEQYYKLKNKYEEEKNKLEKSQNEEIENLRELYINKSEEIKFNPTLEMNNLLKQMKLCAKNKDYSKASEFKFELNNKIETEKEKVNKYKIEKFNKEMEKLAIKHKNEKKILENRYNQLFLSFNKNNSTDYEKVLNKYKNKIRRLENKQKYEIIKLKNIAEENEKGIKRNKNYKPKIIEISPEKTIQNNNSNNSSFKLNKNIEKDKIEINDNITNISSKNINNNSNKKNIKKQNKLNKGPKRDVFK